MGKFAAVIIRRTVSSARGGQPPLGNQNQVMQGGDKSQLECETGLRHRLGEGSTQAAMGTSPHHLGGFLLEPLPFVPMMARLTIIMGRTIRTQQRDSNAFFRGLRIHSDADETPTYVTR